MTLPFLVHLQTSEKRATRNFCPLVGYISGRVKRRQSTNRGPAWMKNYTRKMSNTLMYVTLSHRTNSPIITAGSGLWHRDTEFPSYVPLNFRHRNCFFFNFSTPCISNANNTGTKYVRSMKRTAFWIERNGEYKNSVALVRTRTIPTERPPPFGEVSANFCG